MPVGPAYPCQRTWRGWLTCLRSKLRDGRARVRTQALSGFRNHSFTLLRFRPQLPTPSLLTSAFRWKTEAKKRKVRYSKSQKLVAEPGRIILTDCPPSPGQVPTSDPLLDSSFPPTQNQGSWGRVVSCSLGPQLNNCSTGSSEGQAKNQRIVQWVTASCPRLAS